MDEPFKPDYAFMAQAFVAAKDPNLGTARDLIDGATDRQLWSVIRMFEEDARGSRLGFLLVVLERVRRELEAKMEEA